MQGPDGRNLRSPQLPDTAPHADDLSSNARFGLGPCSAIDRSKSRLRV